MILRRLFLSFLFMAAIMLSFLVTSGDASETLIASPQLSEVAPEFERPDFWIRKIQNPRNLLLTPGKIQKMNEENLKRKDLLLYRIKDLKEDWTKEEILSVLKMDWEKFGRTQEVRYGKSGIPLGDFFWNDLNNNLNQDSLEEPGRMLFGFIIKRTDIRVLPTEESSANIPNHYEFDHFQQSSISPGSPLGIYHFSQDKKWAYVQTEFIHGWVHTQDLAIAKEKREVVDYEEAKDRLVVTGNFLTVFSDPSLQTPAFLAQMGDTFPLLSTPLKTEITNSFYVIRIPSRENNGRLIFRKGYIRADEDVRRGFLPYTQENGARQAFKMLNHPYGWGDRLGGRDCSRFIMDLFRTFGILMPRNSNEQAAIGIDLDLTEGKTGEEKGKYMDQAIPLATLLRLPGHIMLYLGKNQGRHYVIHSLWGIQEAGKSGPTLKKIGKVVVSDLSLGRKGPDGSLMDRITDIRLIGSSEMMLMPLETTKDSP